jgi:hypothetical protein
MLISERNGAAAQKDSLDISQYSSDAELKKKQNKSGGKILVLLEQIIHLMHLTMKLKEACLI